MDKIFVLTFDTDFNHFIKPVDELDIGRLELEQQGFTVWRAYKILTDGTICDIPLDPA